WGSPVTLAQICAEMAVVARDGHETGELMTNGDNPHIGSSFESFLDEQGIREEVTAAAIKEVIAFQIAEEMQHKGITKVRMAEMMNTSRAQLDRLLDPANGGTTLETLMRAAKVVGRQLRLELVWGRMGVEPKRPSLLLSGPRPLSCHRPGLLCP
ncbi:MAG: hypothetical protein U1A06_17765, partial [Hoeflea sp.]|nr:hypothetical protein [Hoeflea sp.]